MGQHYVARFYLRPWSEEGKLYCLNLKARRVLHRGLRAVANEKLFYRLHALTPEEHELIERVLIEPSPEPPARNSAKLPNPSFLASTIKETR